MIEHRARVSGGTAAYCYSCRTLLAIRGAHLQLADGLVPRPETRDGLPRYGLSQHPGLPRRGARSGGMAVRYGIGDPEVFYVNCPNCDRGQVVHWQP